MCMISYCRVYLKTWFPIDFLSTIPWGLFSKLLMETNSKYIMIMITIVTTMIMIMIIILIIMIITRTRTRTLALIT